jgi:threonylcarbamoyladenosine tRNA methylthiotransferase MtaB
VVLTGIHLSSYGVDLEGENLLSLIEAVAQIDGIERIRLGSLDPASITHNFVDKIKTLDKVMPHFHISMQNGSTRILNLMRRKYNMDMARANIHYLKEAFPCATLSADIITGFPCENDDDFNETLEFFKEERFLHLHVFPYSKRKGTVAATMDGQVPEEIKKERLHKLEALEKKIKADILQCYIDRKQPLCVLFESFDGEYNVGHSREFIEVKVKSGCNLSNKIVEVVPTYQENGLLYGEII